jgi:hypothetical protein
LPEGIAVRRLAAALAAVGLLPACGDMFSGSNDSGRAPGPSRVTDGPAAGVALSLEDSGSRVRTVRPGGEVVLRFTRPLEPTSARGAFRVLDESRGRAPVAADVEVRGREAILRAREAGGWRPGAELSVAVSGMPSLRALRSSDGDVLAADAAARVRVRSPRRVDRLPPSLAGSEPTDGAEGVDPSVLVVLRFTEPMDVRSLTGESVGPRPLPLSLVSNGAEIPFRCFLDRTRTLLTVLPEGALPAGSPVAVELKDRVRDPAGNTLAAESPRRVSFRTAEVPAPGPAAGRIVEAFEDRARMDILGTTVRWNDPAERGALTGVLETLLLESGARGDSAMSLDPRGGSFRIHVPAAELGDEVRTLKGLHLLAAPGGLPGEVLEPRVRVAAAPALPVAEALAAEGLAWQDATEGLRGAVPRASDGALVLPFRHPFAYPGSGALLVEVTWKGVAGTVILKATRHAEPRCLLQEVVPEPAAVRTAPVLRFEAVGERLVARSIWIDSGAVAPSWLEPRVRPAADPARVRLQVQAAPPGPDGTAPDVARATPWTAEAPLLEGMRWIRFRVLFEPGTDPLAPSPAVDDLTLPFVAR